MCHNPALCILLVACLAAAGCEPPPSPRWAHRIQELRDENAGLQRELDQARGQQEQDQQQIRQLEALGPRRIEQLFTVDRIEIGRYSGGADTDARAGDDVVRVLLKPIDRDGHALKAAGEAHVQIYDLAADPARNLLHECRIGVDQIGTDQVIKATAPLAEMLTYSTQLRSMTGGEGSYTMEFSHYDIVPGNVQQQIVAASGKKVEEEE